MLGCVYQIWVKQIREFHYNYIKNKRGSNTRLLLTDTDGFMLEIKTKDIQKDVSTDKKIFGFSNFSAKSKQYDDSDKLVFVETKDEVMLLKKLLD